MGLSGRTHKAHLLKRKPRESPGPFFTEESIRRDRRRMFQRKGTRELKSSREPLLEPHLLTSWQRGTRSQRSGKLRESRLSELLRNRRSKPPPRRLLLLLTRKPRRPQP